MKNLFSGGQFAPAINGQFTPAKGGQFTPAGSGQFDRFFQADAMRVGLR